MSKMSYIKDIMIYRKIWYFFRRYDTIQYSDIKNDLSIISIYQIITSFEDPSSGSGVVCYLVCYLLIGLYALLVFF